MGKGWMGWLLAALLVGAGDAAATAQQSDKLLLGDRTYRLNTNPLRAHLERIGWKPPEDAVIWSSNWRGYLADWTIEDGELVLVDATIGLRPSRPGVDARRSIKDSLFPGVPRVVATWYSGALIVPDGKRVDYKHMGYASRYDHYQVFRVLEGRVVEHLSLTGEEFEALADAKFEAFMETEEYRKAHEDLRARGRSEEDIREFLRQFESERYLSM